MRILVYLIAFTLSFNFYSQEFPSFFVEIIDKEYIPTISHDENGTRIAYSNIGNNTLDDLFDSYEIYSNEKVFKNSTRASLQNIYLIKCNDIQLMDDLIDNFSNFYPRVEDASAEALVLPNDFGTIGGYTSTDQEELNYIRAQEAWDVTIGSSDIIIGISDKSIQISHEDLKDKVTHVYGNNYPDNYSSDNQHGAWVASFAAADTNNNKGLSAIGYNSSIYSATNTSVVGVDTLSKMPGVKVINTAWVSSSMPEVYNMVVEDRGVVVVGSAGNGEYRHGSAESLIYPAAFKNVISVSGIGHQNETYTDHEVFLDYHEFYWSPWGEELYSFQHNDSVDIVAPAVGLSRIYSTSNNIDGYADNGRGTSFASPIVSGTIALMFDVNYCIDPKEVETILKLTAVVIDTLPQNLPFYGKLGAGKLDAYEAVKMAKDMADEFGTVEVKDRILYRPWFYKLETAPYEIKMTNNDVSEGAKLKFKARNNIEILSGDYYPSAGGYIDLSIDDTLALDCPPASSFSSRLSNTSGTKSDVENNFDVIPTLVVDNVSITEKKGNSERMSQVKVFDFFGQEVFAVDKINSDSVTMNLNRLIQGIYVLKVFNDKGENKHTQKIIKK